MKKIIIMFVLVSSFVLSTNTVSACSPDILSINKLEANTIVLRPIVKSHSFTDKIVNKDFYILVSELSDGIGCGVNKVYVNKIWLTFIILFIILVFRNFFFKKRL